MVDFSQHAGAASSFDLIPNGTLLWVWTVFRGLKTSKPGGQYLDFEFVVDDNQPYARRKIWGNVGDPMHPANSEKYRQMSSIAVTRMLESGRGANPSNPAAYNVSDDYRELGQIRVAVKIGVEKGQDGYNDKNKIAEFLTPNPKSESGYKGYEKLMKGEHMATPRGAPPAGGGFQQPAAAPAASPAAFAAPVAPVAAPVAPAAPAGAWGGPTPSLPNGPAASSWLKQANGG